MYEWHRLHHPLMEPQDVVKLFFQSVQGCGHLLGNEEIVARRIAEEAEALAPSAPEPLWEPLGPEYMRLNLRPAMAMGIEPMQIARLMKLSQAERQPDRTCVMQALEALGESAVTQAAKQLLQEPDRLPSHTATYHAAYSPAYRVISRKCAVALPALQQINCLPQKERNLICIDGPCGSGKSTLAGILQHVLDAAVIPMDDFFLPHPMKTADRLAQPGGNADWERLRDEFLTPWLRDGVATYRPYDCHANDYGECITIPQRQYTIIEGSYSCLPDIRKHADLCIFLNITPQEQQQRILHRNGEAMLKQFNARWIPLEQAYFSAYQLPDASCLTLDVSAQFV